jgi:hypothetical protein
LLVLLLPSLVLRFCPLEHQLVPIADIQVIGNLKRSVLGVVVDVEQANYRGPRSQAKYPSFLGGWHACAKDAPLNKVDTEVWVS